VYAGAILITYLFVIMLATEAPTADEVESLAEYDRYSREPVIATIFAFVLLAGMTALYARGAADLQPPDRYRAAGRLLELPGRLESALLESGKIAPGTKVRVDDMTGFALVDVAPGRTYIRVVDGAGQPGRVDWPDGLSLGNIEGVGFNLLSDQPGSIEIAGIVLLMAMLGAVVLARKKVDMDEAALAARMSELGVTTHERGPHQMHPGEV